MSWGVDAKSSNSGRRNSWAIYRDEQYSSSPRGITLLCRGPPKVLSYCWLSVCLSAFLSIGWAADNIKTGRTSSQGPYHNKCNAFEMKRFLSWMACRTADLGIYSQWMSCNKRSRRIHNNIANTERRRRRCENISANCLSVCHQRNHKLLQAAAGWRDNKGGGGEGVGEGAPGKNTLPAWFANIWVYLISPQGCRWTMRYLGEGIKLFGVCPRYSLEIDVGGW